MARASGVRRRRSGRNGGGAFDLVVFDFDGTLFDTAPAIVDCVAKTFVTHELRAPEKSLIRKFVGTGSTLVETFIVLGIDANCTRLLSEMTVTYRAIYRNEGDRRAAPFVGAEELLHDLHSNAVDAVIVGNKGSDAILRSLKAKGFAEYIRLVIGDEPDLPRKPDPDLLSRRILPQLGPVASDRILIVGDTEVDLQFAKNAGVESCLACYGYGERSKCEALSPSYRVDAPAELADIVGLRRQRRFLRP